MLEDRKNATAVISWSRLLESVWMLSNWRRSRKPWKAVEIATRSQASFDFFSPARRSTVAREDCSCSPSRFLVDDLREGARFLVFKWINKLGMKHCLLFCHGPKKRQSSQAAPEAEGMAGRKRKRRSPKTNGRSARPTN